MNMKDALQGARGNEQDECSWKEGMNMKDALQGARGNEQDECS